jgi:hypothetical protein
VAAQVWVAISGALSSRPSPAVGCRSRRHSEKPCGRIVTHAAGLVHEPRCDVELTEISTPGQEWWSLAFEAAGLADLLHSALEGTAALVFARALPGGAELGSDESWSYAEWLARQPGAESHADI